MRRVLLICLAFALVLGGLAAWRLSRDFDLSRHVVSEIALPFDGVEIVGSLVLPDAPGPHPVAVIVHGDGPQDRWSDGGYLPLVNALLDTGIGVVSWDKPGVGASGGDWLAQSMADRAVLAARFLELVRTRPGVDPDAVGYLGFSQAGWVVPEAAALSGPAFSVLVGAAMDWQDQGRYYTARRLERLGQGAEEIARTLAAQTEEDDRVFGDGADTPPAGMSPGRWGFIRRNRDANAAEAVAVMPGPVLALWGAEDLNVDPVANPATWRKLRGADPEVRVMVLPGATHGLLRSAWFNTQLTRDWGVARRVAFLGLGRQAFAPGAIDAITDFVRVATGRADAAPA